MKLKSIKARLVLSKHVVALYLLTLKSLIKCYLHLFRLIRFFSYDARMHAKMTKKRRLECVWRKMTHIVTKGTLKHFVTGKNTNYNYRISVHSNAISTKRILNIVPRCCNPEYHKFGEVWTMIGADHSSSVFEIHQTSSPDLKSALQAHVPCCRQEGHTVISFHYLLSSQSL